ncbi:hypothetical protein LCGC14_2893140, partial [marine sediment metagenome]
DKSVHAHPSSQEQRAPGEAHPFDGFGGTDLIPVTSREHIAHGRERVRETHRAASVLERPNGAAG